jgi:hypothetical protein
MPAVIRWANATPTVLLRPFKMCGNATRRNTFSRKAVRAQTDERSMWQKIILPRLGKLRIASIDADHIDELHRDITNVRGTDNSALRALVR